MCDVSVVITTYHRERLVLEAIASALSQSGVELEVIVVDDSPDASARESVASIKDPRVWYLHMKTPSGGRVGRVRNAGAKMATGRFLHFLDDDDHLVEGALAALAGSLSDNKVGMAFGRIIPFGEDIPLTKKMTDYYNRAANACRAISNRYQYASMMLFSEWPLVNSACMVRRDVFQSSGGYNPNVRTYEDIDFYLRIGREYGVKFLDRDVLRYRVGLPSITSELMKLDDVPQMREEYRRLQQEYRTKHGTIEYRALQVWSKVSKILARKEVAYGH
jgi:glycosyltransferase involved in cell wall biosynthesis